MPCTKGRVSDAAIAGLLPRLDFRWKNVLTFPATMQCITLLWQMQEGTERLPGGSMPDLRFPVC